MRELRISKSFTNRTTLLNIYLIEAKKYSLNKVDEVELALKIKDGDQLALNQLVNQNLLFVVSVAKQYPDTSVTFMDLLNEGNIGLIKAAKHFDHTMGFKFISYAVWWIRQSILNCLNNHGRIVKLPLNKLSGLNKLNMVISNLEQKLDRPPSSFEISEELECSVSQIDNFSSIGKYSISLDSTIGYDDENFTLGDKILISDDPNILDLSDTNEMVHKCILLLPKKSQIIINMKFGFDNNRIMSFEDIALSLSCSSEHIKSQLRQSINLLKKIILKYDKVLIKNPHKYKPQPKIVKKEYVEPIYLDITNTITVAPKYLNSNLGKLIKTKKDERENRIIEMFNTRQDLSIKDIANYFNVSKTIISRVIRRNLNN